MTAPRPACGMKSCRRRATHTDTSGVGFCPFHADSDTLPVAERPFDPWWAAATIAREKGGAEAARWANLEHGQWPTEPTE